MKSEVEYTEAELMELEEMDREPGPGHVAEEVQEPAENLPFLEEEEGIPTAEPVAEQPIDLAAEIRKLQDEISAMRKAPKNHVAGKPGDKVYVRLGALNTEGKVPQQQHDLATILTRNMPIGEPFTEAQVFAFLNSEFGDFPSLANSRQDVTYLLRYYRGLKREGKHAGFVARGFISVK